ncbi:hypothetical protein [Desulfosarcina alkanivorans]|nr:hypothetical protein [Desulfosarcina alkanivorans]
MAEIPSSSDTAEPLPAGGPVMPVKQPQPAPPGNTAATLPSRPFHTTEPVSPRDWFDRFTDWVAAVVSLLQ